MNNSQIKLCDFCNCQMKKYHLLNQEVLFTCYSYNQNPHVLEIKTNKLKLSYFQLFINPFKIIMKNNKTTLYFKCETYNININTPTEAVTYLNKKLMLW